MILAIDTSGRDCGVALWLEDLVGIRAMKSALRHNEVLFDLIQTLLAEKIVHYDNLAAITVSSGPGSFTGLRVGMAAAKGLCMVWNIPLIAVPTLEALADGVPLRLPQVLTIIPARATEVYWALFESNGEQRRRKTDDRVSDISELGSACSGDVFLTGEGYSKHQKELDRIFANRRLDLMVSESVEKLVVSTAKLGAARFKEKRFDDLMNSEPNYCYEFPRRKT